jgi:hypothetical protein
VHVGAALVADEQALEVVQHGEGALDDPAVAPETGAVLWPAARDQRLDPSLPEQPAVLVVVGAAVGDHAVGSVSRTADGAAYSGHRVEQRDQLGDVVAIAGGRERESERDPALVDDGAWSRDRLYPPGSGPSRSPFFACTWLESAIARAHSISPAARSRVNSSSCSRSHTPARCTRPSGANT